MKLMTALLAAGLLAGLHGYESSVKHLSPYPKKQAAYWKAPVFQCNDPVVSGCLYGYFVFKKPVSLLQVKLTYRTSKETAVSFSLNYVDQKGRNGGAGRSPVFKLEPSVEFTTKVMNFEVPLTAKSAQFVFGIKGNPSLLELKNIVWTTGSDNAALKEMTVSGKPSSWKKAAELQNFYLAAGGGSARVQTSVRMAYDQKNLYVGFIADEPNMANIKENITKRDGAVWEDDTVELFLFDRGRNSGWQFIVNAKNTQFDGCLRQAQEGDPYKTFDWDGKWSSQVWKNKASWEAAFIIPWSTLKYEKVPEELYMNFARERTGNNEISHWNAFAGNFHTAPKYARAVFGPEGEIIRYRKAETESYIPKRAKTYGKELLSSEPGRYMVGSWGFGCYKNSYPADMRKDFTPEKQRAFLERLAQHNMYGPCFPWSTNKANLPGGLTELKRLHKQYGMTYAYAVFSSAIAYNAIKKYHDPLYNKRRVDPSSEAYTKAALDTIADVKKFVSVPGNRELVAFCHGIDEPTNALSLIYNRRENPELKAALAEFDSKVKAETGYGKYGFYDWSETPDADTPFRKIAFYRYWNKRFNEYLRITTAAIRDIDPKLPYLAVNANTCSGVPVMDLAHFSPNAEWFGCDPYPTSAKNFYGMSRAVYHTGFSVRLIHDLAGRSRTCVMPQAFIYHGGRPTPADMREWASQALKNGAEFFYWYNEGPACVTIPDSFEEMLKISKELTTMNKLILPKETKSAILFSNADRAALDDSACHAAYTVYSILGEQVKANFRFVSPTGLRMKIHSLDGIKVLYVPRMSYTEPESTGLLLDFVKKGGTLVVFDPEIWSFNFDGSTVPERELVTGKLAKRSGVSVPLKYGKKELPVTAAANINRNSGKITAYDFAEVTGKPVAFYPDGKPAAVEKSLGKGTVIFFAVHPFGNSDASLKPEGWKDFFTVLCEKNGEKINLPIWDFVLPEK